MIVRQAILFM